MKNQKGITLVALIVTIIVMLILAGVSVTVALNGGLFRTAKDATEGTQLAIEKKQLLELTIGAIQSDGTVDFTKLDKYIVTDGNFQGTEGTYISIKSGNTFIVGIDGEITLQGENSGSGNQTHQQHQEVEQQLLLRHYQDHGN